MKTIPLFKEKRRTGVIGGGHILVIYRNLRISFIKNSAEFVNLLLPLILR